MMRITILTLGTRGDVQPYIALGLGLKQAGYSVTLGTSKDFGTMIESRGLAFAPFEFSVREILEDPDGRAAFQSKRAAIRLYRKVAPKMPRLLDDIWKTAQGAQAILYHPKIVNSYDIAEKLNVPAVPAFYLPALSPTSAFPAPFIPGPATWGRFLNRMSHRMFLMLMTAPYHRMLNRWRVRTLALSPRPLWGETARRYGKSVMKLYGYSPHLVPTPSDWDDTNHVTGHWFLDRPEDWQPPPGLEEFLAADVPPVFVGFGSISGSDPQKATAIVLDALKKSRQRGILVAGWGGLCAADLPDTVRFVESIPYDWLFPRVAAVVHHGGASSTAEGLRAGKPTVICPFFGDQPFWGRRLYELGVGPRPLAQKRLNSDALADAIHTAVTDDRMRLRAADLGEKIRGERGVDRAVEILREQFRRLSTL
ncbi:MAG TPA: glycosyltransferase [Candidatus Paceibacterota bacterium]|nr:glycosyltransferase [Verrucomicrobiota bacterium]HRY48242.1 glycosyltransferase [Candidatus Paceibacterota bacterium]HSA01726.1 glycosyltransferase [Candidatus Paceibacterota bacterium]